MSLGHTLCRMKILFSIVFAGSLLFKMHQFEMVPLEQGENKKLVRCCLKRGGDVSGTLQNGGQQNSLCSVYLLSLFSVSILSISVHPVRPSLYLSLSSSFSGPICLSLSVADRLFLDICRGFCSPIDWTRKYC